MDSLVAEQVWAVVMFVLGSFILNTCSKWERADQAVLKEAKSYGRRKLDIVKPRTLRGTLMTLLGTGLCLGGMISHIPIAHLATCPTRRRASVAVIPLRGQCEHPPEKGD